MKPDSFESKVHHMSRRAVRITLFEYALIGITVFLVCVLLLFILGIDIYLAFAPALFIVVSLYFWRQRKHDPIRTIEKGNPMLQERLAAAYDNLSKDNLITRSLVKEVDRDLDLVSTDAFLEMKRVNTYVGVCILVVFILLMLLFAGFEGLGVGGLFGGGAGGGAGGTEGEGEGGGGGGGGASGEGDTETTQDVSVGTGPPKDIYGDSSIAEIEGKDMEMEIHPEYGEGEEFDFDEDEDKDKIDEIKDGYTQATVAESYTERIPVELENAVRNYFERLTED